MKRLELLIPPPAVGFTFGVLIVVVATLLPVASFPFRGHVALAIVLVVAGVALPIAGALEMRGRRTTVDPRKPHRSRTLVTTGMFRLSRNPIYLGLASLLMGIALLWVSVPGVLLVFLFCVYMTRFQVLPEERALRAKFGAEFDRYSHRVRRWI